MTSFIGMLFVEYLSKAQAINEFSLAISNNSIFGVSLILVRY